MSGIKTSKNKSPFAKLAHISVVVENIEETIRYYESLGVGPFEAPANHEFISKSYKGQPLNSRLIIREASLGSIILQIVEHLAGDCVAKDCLDRKGPGIYHLGFLVEDVNLEESRLNAAGIDALQKGRREDDTGYTYFDTEKQAGVVLEIKQPPHAG